MLLLVYESEQSSSDFMVSAGASQICADAPGCI